MPDPSPWSVVNDYTKTVVTVSSAFLAFTATFYTNIGKHGPFWLLLVSWALFVVAVAAALYSAARLTSHLRDPRAPANVALLFSNVAYFALFFGVCSFFAYALIAGSRRDVNAESKRATATAVNYAASIDPGAFARTLQIRQVSWDAATERWIVVLDSGVAVARVAVEPDGTVGAFERQP